MIWFHYDLKRSVTCKLQKPHDVWSSPTHGPHWGSPSWTGGYWTSYCKSIHFPDDTTGALPREQRGKEERRGKKWRKVERQEASHPDPSQTTSGAWDPNLNQSRHQHLPDSSYWICCYLFGTLIRRTIYSSHNHTKVCKLCLLCTLTIHNDVLCDMLHRHGLMRLLVSHLFLKAETSPYHPSKITSAPPVWWLLH